MKGKRGKLYCNVFNKANRRKYSKERTKGKRNPCVMQENINEKPRVEKLTSLSTVVQIKWKKVEQRREKKGVKGCLCREN